MNPRPRSNKNAKANRAMADLHAVDGAHPSSRPVGKARSPKRVLRGRVGKGGKRETPVVEVHWLDAVGVATGEWEDETEVSLAPAVSVSVGYLIGETDVALTVVSVVNESHYAHGITIPKGCVTKVVHLG